MNDVNDVTIEYERNDEDQTNQAISDVGATLTRLDQAIMALNARVHDWEGIQRRINNVS